MRLPVLGKSVVCFLEGKINIIIIIVIIGGLSLLSFGGTQSSTSELSLEDVKATVVVRGLYRGCMVLINNGGGWKILTQTVHTPLNLYRYPRNIIH